VGVAEAVSKLSASRRDQRLEAARALGEAIRRGEVENEPTVEVNNHVHTIYSFSPYSPSEVAYRAWKAGLQAVGSMDHDSVAAAPEMSAAAREIGIASTVGCELRVDFSGTAMEGRKLNNPDSNTIVYIALHGIPDQALSAVEEFLGPVHNARNQRNRRMVERLNGELGSFDLPALDFQRDVYAISRAAEGGSITERHILYALAGKIMAVHGSGPKIVHFLEEKLGVPVAGRVRAHLTDPQNPHYQYDLLGVLKSSFLPRIYIQPEAPECAPVEEVLRLANRIGAIPVYPYLGDVTDSPTGDKKAEQFEDSFLDELIPEVKRLGFRAVTYMPPRNTIAQLLRLQKLCRANDLMEISGVDINSSRQSFSCPEILQPEFTHLITTTWALIAHEALATRDSRYALFAPENPLAALPLPQRITRYASIGENLDPRHPQEAAANIDL